MWPAPTNSSEVQAFFLLIVFAFNVLLSAKLLYHVVLGKRAGHVWIERLIAVIASLVVFWLAFDWICFTQVPGLASNYFADPLWGVGGICVAAIASWMYLRFATVEFGWRDLIRARFVWLLLLFSFTATTWSAYRFYDKLIPESFVMQDMMPPGNVLTSDEFVGITDRGRMVHLSKWEGNKEEFDAFDFNALFAKMQGISAVIPRASPDSSSNCHGWVFTGGLFHVGGQVVDQILEDNGYQVVTTPQADDLVIYRDAQQKVVHTGLVRGVLEDGTVIVESKWSVSSRFLHLPQDQPYSEHFGYYRSSRLWHLLTIVPAADMETGEVPLLVGDEWTSGAQTARGETSAPVDDADRVTL